jgi:membrane protein required for colicin V production
MTYAVIDFPCALVVLFFAVSAARRGLIRELFTKAAFILGFAAACLFSKRLATSALRTIGSAEAARVVSFLLLFIAVYLAIRLIQCAVGKLFENDVMAGLDKALGLFFGVAEGAFVVCLLLWALKHQPFFDADVLLSGSFFARLFGGIVPGAGSPVIKAV